jgi:hypothetical protein
MNLKKRLIKELGFVTISALLVVLSFLIAGTFFEIWIRDYAMLLIMAGSFYLVIGFYRILNRIARRYRDEEEKDQGDVKKS